MLGLLPLEHRLIRTLSTGQRRRVALARLVANPRPVWILDEPELGLDRTNRALVDSLIRKHREDGGIVMVASHHIEHIDGCLEINFADAA
jgi:heme exporter protein A